MEGAAGAGELYLITGLPDVTITNLRCVGGGLVEMVAMESPILGAAIDETAGILGYARGDVILTAAGGIAGSIGCLTADHIRLHAFGDPLAVGLTTAEAALLSAGARSGATGCGLRCPAEAGRRVIARCGTRGPAVPRCRC